MREIIFRGKRIDNGEWVYGSLLKSETSTNGYCECTIVGNFAMLNDVIRHDVIPETISQFTGLLDKNRNKIFEGDILVADWHWYNGYTVDLSDYSFHYTLLEYGLKSSNLEIIGNIHDHATL